MMQLMKLKINYGALREQANIKAAKKEIIRKVEPMQTNFEAALVINTARVHACESIICFMENQIKVQNTTTNEFINTQTGQMEPLKLELSEGQRSATTVKQTTYVTRHIDETANEIKFSGGENENPKQMLKQIERNTELINDNLGDGDK